MDKIILRDYIRLKEKEAIEKNMEKEAIKLILIDLKYQTKENLLFSYNESIDPQEFDEKISMYLDSHIPVQYITGKAYFYNMCFMVNKNVLIPRPETELVCEEAINLIKKQNKKIRILDIGTGSGAIIITICNNVSSLIEEAVAVDISNDSLEVAKKNAFNLINGSVEDKKNKIKFIQSDLFSSLKDYKDENNKFDVIISNPPYIENDASLDDIVVNNEPHLALFGGVDGLDFYKRIIIDSQKYIKKDGIIVFEIGHNQGLRIKDLALQVYKKADVRIINDYANLNRIVTIKIGE